MDSRSRDYRTQILMDLAQRIVDAIEAGRRRDVRLECTRMRRLCEQLAHDYDGPGNLRDQLDPRD